MTRNADRTRSEQIARRGLLIRGLGLGVLGCLGASVLLTRPTGAAAQSLDEAKAQGLVGERRDAVIRSGFRWGAITALVNAVNEERRQAYERIAAENGLPLAQVERLAAEKLLRVLNPGRS